LRIGCGGRQPRSGHVPKAKSGGDLQRAREASWRENLRAEDAKMRYLTSMTGTRPIRNLALIGFMGTGKSSVGRVAAEQMHFTFLDTDHVIEAWASFGNEPIWTYLLAFGDTVSGGGQNGFWFTPHSGYGG
jgi:hypothetical protein